MIPLRSIALGVLLLATMLPAAKVVAHPRMDQAIEVSIQPGAAIISDGGTNCSLAWILDGVGRLKGKTFAVTAAHCTEGVGSRIGLQTTTLGEKVFTFGRVVVSEPSRDYALIEIASKHERHVDPALKGHSAIPQGVTTSESAQVGDVLQYSSYGAGFHAHEATREQRRGILWVSGDDFWSAAGVVVPGDSGGPIADVSDGDKALGIITLGCLGPDCLGSAGVTLSFLLEQFAGQGYPLRLRTVP